LFSFHAFLKVGATTSLFPYTRKMREYLVSTGREHVAQAADKYSDLLLKADPGAKYDQVIEINLSNLEPHLSTFLSFCCTHGDPGFFFSFVFSLTDFSACGCYFSNRRAIHSRRGHPDVRVWRKGKTAKVADQAVNGVDRFLHQFFLPG
jgi:hypothetical protein